MEKKGRAGKPTAYVGTIRWEKKEKKTKYYIYRPVEKRYRFVHRGAENSDGRSRNMEMSGTWCPSELELSQVK